MLNSPEGSPSLVYANVPYGNYSDGLLNKLLGSSLSVVSLGTASFFGANKPPEPAPRRGSNLGSGFGGFSVCLESVGYGLSAAKAGLFYVHANKFLGSGYSGFASATID